MVYRCRVGKVWVHATWQEAESTKQQAAWGTVLLTRMLPPRAELSLLPRPGFVAFPGIVPAPFLILQLKMSQVSAAGEEALFSGEYGGKTSESLQCQFCHTFSSFMALMLPSRMWGSSSACLWILMLKHFRDFGVDSGQLIAVKQLSGGSYKASLSVNVKGV